MIKLRRHSIQAIAMLETVAAFAEGVQDGVDEEKPPPEWTCPQCSYRNKVERATCELCDFDRPQMTAASAPPDPEGESFLGERLGEDGEFNEEQLAEFKDAFERLDTDDSGSIDKGEVRDSSRSSSTH